MAEGIMRIQFRPTSLTLLVGAAFILASPAPAQAQFGKRLKEALKQKAEQKAVEKATVAEESAIDEALAGDQNGAAAPAAEATAAATAPTADASAAPAEKTLWVNYDFVPGGRTLFYTDYAEDAVGNFPERLEFGEGNMEVVELGGERYIRATSHGSFTIPLPETLPSRFTIEIDVINRPSLDGSAFQLQGGVKPNSDRKTSTIAWGSDGLGSSAAAAARSGSRTTRRIALAIAANPLSSAFSAMGSTSRRISTSSVSSTYRTPTSSARRA
jgi:hypothetical protein